MMLVSVLVAGCGNPVASVRTANQLADGFVEAVGVEPDSREVIERNNNMVNTLADTVTLRWEGIDLGDDALEVLAAALEQAGIEVVYRAPEIPEGRPRTGAPDPDELKGCVAGSDPEAGGKVSAGVTPAGLEVVAEFGGPPASSGCAFRR